MALDGQKLLQLLDKHVDQEGFVKDVVLEYVKPWILEKQAKIVSGEIDLIPGTDLDKVALVAACEFLLKQVE